MTFLIDSHCHLDAGEFGQEAVGIMRAAQRQGVAGFVIPAVARANWNAVAQLAQQVHGAMYTLGIHPMYINSFDPADIALLRAQVQLVMNDPKFLGIGEIGLDYFEPNLDRELQWTVFVEQLKIAKDFDLPVIMHVRRSQDMVLKGLRQIQPVSGIAHAFNGSEQQAVQFFERNICMGFGGAMTFTRALQIRRLAAQLPIQAIVLETDAPDIAPEWINHQRNDSTHLPRIAQVLAQLRQETDLDSIWQATTDNVLRVLPRAGGFT
jgi:TatD DNase family protein